MSVLTDYEIFKQSTLLRCDSSGEVNLEGVKFPVEVPRIALWRRVMNGLRAFGRFVGDVFREDPGAYNERISRRYDNQPPVRGLW
jgi:hypothetical protein